MVLVAKDTTRCGSSCCGGLQVVCRTTRKLGQPPGNPETSSYQQSPGNPGSCQPSTSRNKETCILVLVPANHPGIGPNTQELGNLQVGPTNHLETNKPGSSYQLTNHPGLGRTQVLPTSHPGTGPTTWEPGNKNTGHRSPMCYWHMEQESCHAN